MLVERGHGVCGRCGGRVFSSQQHLCPDGGNVFTGTNGPYPIKLHPIELPQHHTIIIDGMPGYKLVVPNEASIYEVNQVLGKFLEWTNEVIANGRING